jgi:RNA polymerase sigma-70 factor (ECF subfamily)
LREVANCLMEEPSENHVDDLVQRYRDGDHDAFRQLVEANAESLRGALARQLPGWLGRRVSVVDIVQDSCVVAFRRCAEFEGRSRPAFRRWLFGIARMRLRKCIERHRMAMRDARMERTRGMRPDTVNHLARGGASPSQEAIGGETRALLEDALARLSDDYRRVLQLTRDEDLPPAEIAQRMGRSEEAVRKLRDRALLELSRAFARLQERSDG